MNKHEESVSEIFEKEKFKKMMDFERNLESAMLDKVHDLMVVQQPNGLWAVLSYRDNAAKGEHIKLIYSGLTEDKYKVLMSTWASLNLKYMLSDEPLVAFFRMSERKEYEMWIDRIYNCIKMKMILSLNNTYNMRISDDTDKFWITMAELKWITLEQLKTMSEKQEGEINV